MKGWPNEKRLSFLVDPKSMTRVDLTRKRFYMNESKATYITQTDTDTEISIIYIYNIDKDLYIM